MNRQEFINRRTAYWQKRLRIQDWGINVTVVDVIDYSDPDSLRGLCTTTPALKTAEIILAENVRVSMEQTLVHELLHVVFAGVVLGLDHDSYQSKYAFEPAIDSMMKALLEI